MIINSLKELEARGYVQYGDIINITINGKVYQHDICESYVEVYGYSNAVLLDAVFEQGNPYKAAEEAYGYLPSGGTWPTYRRGDYPGAYRLLVKAWRRLESQSPQAVVPEIKMGSSVNTIDGPGIIMHINREQVSVALSSGEVLDYLMSDLLTLNKTKTKQDEYVQTTSVSEQRGKGSTGSGISGSRSTTPIGRGHSGNVTSIKDSPAEIRTGKISGSILKF